MPPTVEDTRPHFVSLIETSLGSVGVIALACWKQDGYGPAMDRTLAYTRSNRISWNTIAPARASQPAEFFLRGGSTLEDFEADLLPDLDGKRMLHLACANGVDSISWALRGASVTGVDISDVAIESASALARETAADAHFVAADMYEMPAELRDFDVIYASWGVVCWLPDLDRWAHIVVERLRSGGTFLLCEHHPSGRSSASGRTECRSRLTTSAATGRPNRPTTRPSAQPGQHPRLRSTPSYGQSATWS